MHARPEIAEKLIELKLKGWCRTARRYTVDPCCPRAKARKNFWRLLKAHPEIAQRLGYTLTSVYL